MYADYSHCFYHRTSYRDNNGNSTNGPFTHYLSNLDNLFVSFLEPAITITSGTKKIKIKSDKPKVNEPSESKFKKCPFCGEEILAIAIRCKHCQRNIKPSKSEAFVNNIIGVITIWAVIWLLAWLGVWQLIVALLFG